VLDLWDLYSTSLEKSAGKGFIQAGYAAFMLAGLLRISSIDASILFL